VAHLQEMARIHQTTPEQLLEKIIMGFTEQPAPIQVAEIDTRPRVSFISDKVMDIAFMQPRPPESVGRRPRAA
jgi:hypothetical protein